MPVYFSNLTLWIAVVSIFLTLYLFILALSYRKETLEQRLKRFTALRPAHDSETKKKDIQRIAYPFRRIYPCTLA